ELLIPLKQLDSYHAIHRLDAPSVMLAAINAGVSYSQLPMITCSAIHRSLVDRLRARTGRVFGSRSPDVYSAFAFGQVAGTYHSLTAPMGISALSGGSTGVAELYLSGRSPVAGEFQRLNAEAGHTCHALVPDLPVMPARVADSFQQAKDALFPH